MDVNASDILRHKRRAWKQMGWLSLVVLICLVGCVAMTLNAEVRLWLKDIIVDAGLLGIPSVARIAQEFGLPATVAFLALLATSPMSILAGYRFTSGVLRHNFLLSTQGRKFAVPGLLVSLLFLAGLIYWLLWLAGSGPANRVGRLEEKSAIFMIGLHWFGIFTIGTTLGYMKMMATILQSKRRMD